MENHPPKTYFPISVIMDVNWRVRINWSWAGTETSQSLAGFGDGQAGAKLQPSRTQKSKTAPWWTYRNCLFLLLPLPWALWTLLLQREIYSSLRSSIILDDIYSLKKKKKKKDRLDPNDHSKNVIGSPFWHCDKIDRTYHQSPECKSTAKKFCGKK